MSDRPQHVWHLRADGTIGGAVVVALALAVTCRPLGTPRIY